MYKIDKIPESKDTKVCKAETLTIDLPGRMLPKIDSTAHSMKLILHQRHYKDFTDSTFYLIKKDGMGERIYTGLTLLNCDPDLVLATPYQTLYTLLLQMVNEYERAMIDGCERGMKEVYKAHAEGRLKKSTSKGNTKVWITIT
jgi:hypothetical protein